MNDAYSDLMNVLEETFLYVFHNYEDGSPMKSYITSSLDKLFPFVGASNIGYYNYGGGNCWYDVMIDAVCSFAYNVFHYSGVVGAVPDSIHYENKTYKEWFELNNYKYKT